jgi:two-component system, sensor histidine kinase SagS
MGMTLLVVDDEPAITGMLSDDLTEAGFRVITANSGYEALRYIMQGDADAVISDIAMPDMDGCELLTRAKELRPELPVILMTGFGYDPNHVLLRSRQVGVDGILFKPFAVEDLIKRIGDLPGFSHPA